MKDLKIFTDNIEDTAKEQIDLLLEQEAFKNYYELKDIQKVDLLLIIEFLQLDRKQWINQYSKAHNDYVELKDNWNELKEWLEEYIENIKMQYQNSEPTRQYSLQVIKDTLQVTIDKIQELESRK